MLPRGRGIGEIQCAPVEMAPGGRERCRRGLGGQRHKRRGRAPGGRDAHDLGELGEVDGPRVDGDPHREGARTGVDEVRFDGMAFKRGAADVAFPVGPIHVRAVEGHAVWERGGADASRVRYERRIGVAAIQVGPADRVLLRVGPVDVRTVDGQPGRRAGAGEQAVRHAAAVVVGATESTPARAESRAVDGPVDVGVRSGRPVPHGTHDRRERGPRQQPRSLPASVPPYRTHEPTIDPNGAGVKRPRTLTRARSSHRAAGRRSLRGRDGRRRAGSSRRTSRS